MIKKIDINSEEFQLEFNHTIKYTNEVLEKFNLVYNPDLEINESIQKGLTRNKLIYGERFCPCFMVIGDTLEEQKQNGENRLCPCTPALQKEIPTNGNCHCGIFCTKEKATELLNQNHLHEAVANHNGLSKDECEALFSQGEINSTELEALLEARKAGVFKFNLVDNREWMEWVRNRITGTDFLVPTTSFYQSIEQISSQKDIPTVVYCQSGSRSAYCQRVMLDLGFKKVVNLDYGISYFQGEKERGES